MKGVVFNMDKQEKLARQWAEETRDNFMSSSELEEAAAEYILEHTAPPTMVDVDWDHETMPGTGALTKNGRLWIMRDDAGDAIDCISTDLAEIAFVAKEGLTPNGKRYELREIVKPGHPEILETVADFRGAPEGTVVARDNLSPWWKTDDGTWERIYDEKSDTGMAFQHGVYKVLRWGGEA